MPVEFVPVEFVPGRISLAEFVPRILMAKSLISVLSELVRLKAKIKDPKWINELD